METYYIVVSMKELAHLKENGYLRIIHEDFCEEEKRMSDWMLAEMRKHLPRDAFNCNEDKNDAIFMFLNLDDICMEWIKDNVILEIKQNPKHVLLFDDNDYVLVANNIMNNKVMTYLARSEREAKEYENASKELIEASWNTMFDLTCPRDIVYCGSFEPRATTPYISSDMVVRKVSTT